MSLAGKSIEDFWVLRDWLRGPSAGLIAHRMVLGQYFWGAEPEPRRPDIALPVLAGDRRAATLPPSGEP
jgi:hypothetical protein